MPYVDNFASQVSNLPELPGSYRMIGENSEVLYIGKAKNIKKRVQNYLRDDIPNRLKRMVFLTKHLEFTVTKNEAEALLLEASLIKKYQPKFNILLKDDKSFPYIKLSDHDFPQISKFRGKKLEKGIFFGPFASSADVDSTIQTLQKIFKIRPCTDNYFSNRKRPCLQYQIKRCSAPCVGKILQEEYVENIAEARDFLKGKNSEIQKKLAEKMEYFSENMEYEKAAEIRDRIKALSYIQLKTGISETGISDADVITLVKNNNITCLYVAIYRGGQNFGGKDYFPLHIEDSKKEDVMLSFIGQFYQTRKNPEKILLNIEIEKEDIESLEIALEELHKSKVKLIFPKRGILKKLVDHVEINATEAINTQIKKQSKNIENLQKIKTIFSLDEIPNRIEIYDNSHIMGKFAVGAMVVASPDGFLKNEYRKFTIKTIDEKTVTGGDDYAMLREVMIRRLKRVVSEPVKKPDFMIIDGGAQHLSVVKKTMQEMNIFVPFVCMSKGVNRNAGNENFHMIDREVFTLDKNEDVMKYLQILRDEVHNYAITSHRKKRSLAIKYSSLDSLENIGKKRKSSLLRYFGSFDEIKKASIEELSKIDGISSHLASQIYEQLKK